VLAVVDVLLVVGVLADVVAGGVVTVVEEPLPEEPPQAAKASAPIASIKAESLGMERVFAATGA
jgi:hypothetical protein